jgi:hypothetical protein
MAFEYDILCQVNFLHGYFDDGIARGLVFSPTAGTQRILDEHRIRFKSIPGGFILITEKIFDGLNWVPVIPVDPVTCFNFFVTLEWMPLLNVTDADLTKFNDGNKFYFRNSAATPVVNSGNQSVFTVFSGATVSAGLRIAAPGFSFPVDPVLNPYQIRLRDADNNLISEKIVPRNSSSQITVTGLQMADDSLPENIYLFQQVSYTNIVLQQDVFFLTNSNPDIRAAGIFQIQYNAAVDTSPGGEKIFNVQLSARKIKWSYHVQVDQYTLPTEIPNNIDPAKVFLNNLLNSVPVLGTSFTSSLTPGPPIFVDFISNIPVALRETPYQGIQLIDKGPPLRIILDNLPNPDAEFIQKTAGQLNMEVALKIK